MEADSPIVTIVSTIEETWPGLRSIITQADIIRLAEEIEYRLVKAGHL